MSYHGRATRLIAGGNWAELNSMLREADATIAAKDAEIASLREANRYLVRISNEAIQDASNYCEAQKEISRLREVLSVIAYPLNIGKIYHMDAVTQARAALAQAAEVGK